MNSATSGLFAAIGALGLGYGDEVIVSPYTMTACALAPLIYGAIPIFADVEPQSGCLSLESIQDRVTERTRAILIVHQFGFPADMTAIMEFANARGLHVIEDCAQAHGASINGQPVGTFGDIGVFSLNVNKTIQVGEGGICVTHDDNLAYRLRLIRNHGEAVVGPAGYADIVNIAGFNYRMTELQAGMAREQLKKLDVLNSQRLEMVRLLIDLLDSNPYVSVLTGSSAGTRRTSQATYYVVPLRFDHATAEVSRTQFVQALNAEGLLLAEGYVRPLYLQPLYQTRTLFKHGYPWTAPPNLASKPNYSAGSCPVAEQLHFEDLIISEHVRPPHQRTDIREIVSAINKVCGIRRRQ
jgi:dTDP-4-amino-4,6-dideoxygalactose transaminase